MKINALVGAKLTLRVALAETKVQKLGKNYSVKNTVAFLPWRYFWDVRKMSPCFIFENETTVNQ